MPEPTGAAPRHGVRRPGRTAVMFAALLASNALAWVWAAVVFGGSPVLLGAAGLAYMLGLRHALDADHIAAIDNVTRKLMREGRRTQSVGLYFSLGHSTVVLLAALALAIASSAFQARIDTVHEVASIVGTVVSALFLLSVGAANLVSLAAGWRALAAAKRGEALPAAGAAASPALRGPVGRLLRPVLRMVGRSWHLYPVGFLFGLGFDTASEVGLLALSAAQAAHGLAVAQVLVFPALFAAGMSLLDTTDAVVMTRLYGWAFGTPIRTLYYNLAITFVSVAVAVVVGGIEASRLVAQQWNGSGASWDLSERSSVAIGAAIVAVSLACWAISALVDRRSARINLPE